MAVRGRKKTLIYATFSKADIVKMFRQAQVQADKALIEAFYELGVECVEYARALKTYNNITGNLRNSVGFVIARKGRILRSNFRRSATVYKTVVTKSGKSRRVKTKGGTEGIEEGRKAARALASQYAGEPGLQLFIVAGMYYSVFVEKRGKDVITGAMNLARSKQQKVILDVKSKFAVQI